MTTNNLDTEEQRLRDAVVEAVLRFWEMPDTGELESLQYACTNTTVALRAHLSRQFLAVPVCEPPLDLRHETQHWLKHGDCLRAWWWSGTHWHAFNDETHFSREKVAGWGWTWHSVARPAIPPTEKVEPDSLAGEFTDEDAAKVGHSLMAAIDANLDHPLMRDWAPAEDPAEIISDLLSAFDEKCANVQVEATDEAIDAAIGPELLWPITRPCLRRAVRAALSHFKSPPPPSISDAEIAAEIMHQFGNLENRNSRQAAHKAVRAIVEKVTG